MSARLYSDVHIPRAIVAGLRRRGVDVLRAQDDGICLLPDNRLLDRSTELARVLFTYDDNLLATASSRHTTGKHFAGVIFARAKNVQIGSCVHQLEALHKAGDPDAFSDRATYLGFTLP